MTALPDFRLEALFSAWEFAARYNLAASDAESITLAELLGLARPEDIEAFEHLWLGYTRTYGASDLRETIASTYEHRTGDDVLCFAGAGEGIYAAMRVLLGKEDHAVVITPNYQSAETVPLSLCAVSGVPLDPNDGWSLDLDRVAAAIRPETRVVSINFPHNPTGKILELDRFAALVELCRKRGIWLFSDETYRLLGPEGVEHLPQVADVYERGLSLGVMSKAYGLAGLRIGWIACSDRNMLLRMERMKHYLSICNSGPSERLALIALRARERLLAQLRADHREPCKARRVLRDVSSPVRLAPTGRWLRRVSSLSRQRRRRGLRRAAHRAGGSASFAFGHVPFRTQRDAARSISHRFRKSRSCPGTGGVRGPSRAERDVSAAVYSSS